MKPLLVRAGTRLRTIPFASTEEAERYQRRRYRRLPQRLLGERECRLVASILSALPLERPSILDTPCGYGRLIEAAKPVAGLVLGADLSPAQAQLASGKAPAAAGNILAGLPFADQSFDVVLCIRFLHHLLDPRDQRSCLAELARLARRFVVVSYYAKAPLWILHRRCLEWLRLRKPRVANIAKAGMAELGEQAGVRLLRTYVPLPLIHAHRLALFEVDRR